MHHVALDRAGPDDRHLDDQVIEGTRFQTRKHGHLGPAFDLEDAKGIAAAEHVVDQGILGRQIAEVEAAAEVERNEVEGLADAGQHAESEDVDLEHAERVDVVLVPFDDRAPVHGGILDRHDVREGFAGDDEAADMLRKMAREADQRGGKFEGESDAPVAGIETERAQLRILGNDIEMTPDLACENARDVGGKAERLADFTDGAASAVADHDGRQGSPFAAVLGVDVLDHILAPFMFEIDIDVGRFVARHGDETLEQKVVPVGIDSGDAKTVAHGGIGRRTAPLAEDSLFAGMADDVVDGEKVGSVGQSFDQDEFVVDAVLHLRRHEGAVAPARSLGDQASKTRLRCFAVRHDFTGVFVGQFVEIEPACFGDPDAPLKRFGIAFEKSRHLARPFQAAFGVGCQAQACLVDRAVFADSGQDIGKRAPVRMVVAHVIGGNHGRSGGAAEFVEHGKAFAVTAVKPAARTKEHLWTVSRDVHQSAGEGMVGESFFRGQDNQYLAVCMGLDVGPGEGAAALAGTPPPQGDQA